MTRETLLYLKVNKVTAYHRHGNKIPDKVLDELVNAQIAFEAQVKENRSLPENVETKKEFLAEFTAFRGDLPEKVPSGRTIKTFTDSEELWKWFQKRFVDKAALTTVMRNLIMSNHKLGVAEYERDPKYNNEHFHYKAEMAAIKFMEVYMPELLEGLLEELLEELSKNEQ